MNDTLIEKEINEIESRLQYFLNFHQEKITRVLKLKEKLEANDGSLEEEELQKIHTELKQIQSFTNRRDSTARTFDRQLAELQRKLLC